MIDRIRKKRESGSVPECERLRSFMLNSMIFFFFFWQFGYIRSRLGCQVLMNKELDGIIAKIPSMTRNAQA